MRCLSKYLKNSTSFNSAALCKSRSSGAPAHRIGESTLSASQSVSASSPLSIRDYGCALLVKTRECYLMLNGSKLQVTFQLLDRCISLGLDLNFESLCVSLKELLQQRLPEPAKNC